MMVLPTVTDSLANQLLNYTQQISTDPLAPVTVAVLSQNYIPYIKILHSLWSQQSRPWHIILVDRDYKQQTWLGLEQYFPQKISSKVLPMRGMHRVDIEPYQFTVSMLFDESPKAWTQIVAQVHIFIVDAYREQDCRDAWRMSVARPLLYCVESEDDVWLTFFKHQHFSLDKSVILEKGGNTFAKRTSLENIADATNCDGAKLYYLSSQRPEKIVAAQSGRNITVIGAGVAGAGVAFAMANRGWQVTVLDPMLEHREDTEAYRYASGAVTPLLTADDCHKARLSRAGVLRAHARWRNIAEQAGIRYCGTLELNRDKGHAKDLLDIVRDASFPDEWVQLLTAEEATVLAGIELHQEAAFFPMAMQIPPIRLASTLLQHPNIKCLSIEVDSIQKDEQQGFILHTDKGVMSAQVLLIATAMNSRALLEKSGLTHRQLKSGQQVNALQRLDSLHALAGEVMMVSAEYLNGGPRCVIGGQGYYLPAQEGFCVMGSTYEHGNLSPQVTEVGQETILRKIPLNLPVSLKTLRQNKALKGRACVRAVLQGRLPIIAEVPHHPHLWVATAYASHGMTWSSLAGDIIGASLEGEPVPIEKDLLGAVAFKDVGN